MMSDISVDQDQEYKFKSLSINKKSEIYSSKMLKEDDKFCDNSLLSSNSSCIDQIWFDPNVVKCLNENLHSVRPFIQSIEMDEDKINEDHVVPRRSLFQMFIHPSISTFYQKNRFYPKQGSLLNIDQWNKLLSWNIKSSNNQWNLLYKGTIHGFNAKDFHHFCDNKGPTITVIRTSKGRILGGYTRVSWHSDQSHFVNDPYAFLFSFSSNSSIKYSLIDRTSKHAVWNAPNYGPTFGRGADLFVCSQCNLIEESYSRLPSSYKDPTRLAHKALAGQQQFLVQDIEVYS